MIYISPNFYISEFPDTVGGGVTQGDVDWYGLFSGGTVCDQFGNCETLKGDFGPGRPRIGWENLIISQTILADFEDINHPASNIANPSTAEYWRSASGEEETEQYIYFSTDELGACDYIGIAGHNFGSTGTEYVLQSRSGDLNYQEIDIGGASVGTDIAIDAIDGVFQFIISIDGGANQLISVAYSSATDVTFSTLIDDINAELSGATIALSSGNLRVTSDTAAPDGSIIVKPVNGINYFATYVNGYVGISNSSGWSDAFTATTAINNIAIFHQFFPVDGESWRLAMRPPSGNTVPLEIATVYVGRALILPRGIYVGHTPIPYGRVSNILTNRSENGKFLGRVKINSFRVTDFDMKNIGPIFYRVYVEPFVNHAETMPYFFAWYPSKFPNECGFVWSKADVIPENQRSNGMVSFKLSMEGIA